MSRLWAYALLCGLAWGGAGLAQTGGEFRIASKAVSALDGRPLDHASVAVEVVKTRARVASVVTGADGAFTFEHLPAGKYTLAGDAPGFLPANLDQHEQFSTAVVAGAAGVDAEHLLLRLKPAAGISGRIFDEAGEGVRMAQVTLYGENRGTGKAVVGRVRSAQTDDRGEYTMGSLPEGKYYLGVRATPWYATHPEPRNENGGPGNGSPVVTGIDPALDAAYPLTFYPDVQDWHDAVPVELKAGGEARLDLHLAPVRAARLTVRKGQGEEQIAFPELRMKVFDTTEPVQVQSRGYGDSLDVVGVPPGHYTVRRRGARNGGAGPASTVDLGANGQVELQPGNGAPAAALKVTVERANGAKLPAGTRIALRGGDDGEGNAGNLGEGGAAALESVPAGDYRVVVFGNGRAYSVLRTEVKGKPPGRDKVALGGGEQAEARVVVADGPLPGVEGVARAEGKGVAGAMIVLVPVDDPEDAGMFRRDQSDLDGTFVLQNVLPGRYIAVAIDDGWRLEWGKAAVLAKYLAKGVPVEVGAGSGARTMKLPEALVVQGR